MSETPGSANREKGGGVRGFTLTGAFRVCKGDGVELCALGQKPLTKKCFTCTYHLYIK